MSRTPPTAVGRDLVTFLDPLQPFPAGTGSPDHLHRSRCASGGVSPTHAASIPARTGAYTDSPAVVRWETPAGYRVRCLWLLSCASSVPDRRFLTRRIPTTS